MSPHPTPIRRDLRILAAEHHLGAWLNAVDELGKVYDGADVIPPSVWRAVMTLHAALAV